MRLIDADEVLERVRHLDLDFIDLVVDLIEKAPEQVISDEVYAEWLREVGIPSPVGGKWETRKAFILQEKEKER